MKQHNYTSFIYAYGFDHDVGVVQISPSTQYGYWEHKDGSEGGGLWFDGKELIDFDGAYALPNAIVKALREHGFTLDESFD